MKFIVTTREVWTQDVAVETDTAAQAIDLVYHGGGEFIGGIDYSHTLDPDTWTVRPGG